jgi:hypothetical protein
MFIYFIVILSFSKTLGVNVLSQSDILRYEWYSSREFCISLKTIILQWKQNELVMIMPEDLYAQFSMHNENNIFSKVMVHDCIQTPVNKMTRHWCGYLAKSADFKETTKIKLTSLVGTYALISPKNEVKQMSRMNVPITKFEEKLPLPSGLSTDILCRNCSGVCHRPCWSVALGSNKTTCISVENTTGQALTTQKCVPGNCEKEIKNRHDHKHCFYKYLKVLETISDDAANCNVSIFFYVIYLCIFFIIQ